MIKLKYKLSAIIMAGFMSGISTQAMADIDFNNISNNITLSLKDVPGLVSAVAYLLGTLFSVLGIMKIKDHVENPSQTPLKDGAIRLCAGGALFSLPIIFEAMSNTIGSTGNGNVQADLDVVSFGLISPF